MQITVLSTTSNLIIQLLIFSLENAPSLMNPINVFYYTTNDVALLSTFRYYEILNALFNSNEWLNQTN
jgi:hypothetical protein